MRVWRMAHQTCMSGLYEVKCRRRVWGRCWGWCGFCGRRRCRLHDTTGAMSGSAAARAGGKAASETAYALGAVPGAPAGSSPAKLFCGGGGGLATLITGGSELPPLRPTPSPTPRPMARATTSTSTAMQAQRLKPHRQGLAVVAADHTAPGVKVSLPFSTSLAVGAMNLL